MTLIIVHGLEGSSRSQYVIGTANKAYAAGMNAIRMNMRNCGGTEALTPTLYHSGLSCDVAAVAAALAREEKIQGIAIAGFSMGGNLVLKCAGEWGDSPPEEIKAVCAISPTMDLSASVDAIHLRRNLIYEAKFLWGLNRRIRRKAALFPERYQLNGMRWLRSIREFDDRITAPHSGFKDAEDYYFRAAAARVVERIRVPTLIVHAADDPVVRLTPETRAKIAANPAITFVEPLHGGHCAFLAAQDGYDGRWAERQIVRFVQHATEER
jgi:predicted alpha/beta-fold hydrolase